MSKALEYLLKARPEAMQNYFAFLKQAGSRLDPRTRALISVITKVDNQTEAGFRQYLKRALSEGVTADEVLDALLLAFPSLGLTKIVWAMDILLSMDLVEFQLENLSAAADWHPVVRLDRIPDRAAWTGICDGRTVFLYRDGETVSVYDNHCPHQSTALDNSHLQGETLTCPRHHWQFDLATGRCNGPGDRPLNRLRHRVRDGIVEAFW